MGGVKRHVAVFEILLQTSRSFLAFMRTERAHQTCCCCILFVLLSVQNRKNRKAFVKEWKMSSLNKYFEFNNIASNATRQYSFE